MRKYIFPVLLAILPMTASANSSFYSTQILDVNRVSDTTFEVIDEGRSSTQEYWCTAGLHVNNVLRKYQSRIYLAKTLGPSQTEPGKQAVLFSTEPVENPFTKYTLTIREPGVHISSGYARRVCEDSLDDFSRFSN